MTHTWGLVPRKIRGNFLCDTAFDTTFLCDFFVLSLYFLLCLHVSEAEKLGNRLIREQKVSDVHTQKVDTYTQKFLEMCVWGKCMCATVHISGAE